MAVLDTAHKCYTECKTVMTLVGGSGIGNGIRRRFSLYIKSDSRQDRKMTHYIAWNFNYFLALIIAALHYINLHLYWCITCLNTLKYHKMSSDNGLRSLTMKKQSTIKIFNDSKEISPKFHIIRKKKQTVMKSTLQFIKTGSRLNRFSFTQQLYKAVIIMR